MISLQMSYRLDNRNYAGHAKDSDEQQVALHRRKTTTKRSQRREHMTSAARARSIAVVHASRRSISSSRLPLNGCSRSRTNIHIHKRRFMYM